MTCFHAEVEIVEHMNGDHADAVALMVFRMLNLPGGDRKMTRIDPEGCDFRSGGETARLDWRSFGIDSAIIGAETARSALVRLTKAARAES